MSENDVIRLFDKFYDVLGFDSPSRIEGGFPDAYTYKDGKKITIEFEYLLGRLSIHYIFARVYPLGRFIKKNKKWYVINHDGNFGGWHEPMKRWNSEIMTGYDKHDNPVIFDPNNELQATKSFGIGGPYKNVRGGTKNILILKSLKNELDLVVCWRNDRSEEGWTPKNLASTGVQIIELEKELNKENLIKKNAYLCVFCNTHKTTKIRQLFTPTPICDNCFKTFKKLSGGLIV